MTDGRNTIDLRPHEANVRSDAYMALIKPTRLLSFQPHMHAAGRPSAWKRSIRMENPRPSIARGSSLTGW